MLLEGEKTEVAIAIVYIVVGVVAESIEGDADVLLYLVQESYRPVQSSR